jgi:hypothetical protein
MSRRRSPRVPPTFGTRLARLAAVAREHAEPGGVYIQPIAHDSDCPSVETQRLRDCRCEPWFQRPGRVA